eukprot:TRINITY_DN5_c0_g2_i1.p1 TRINITY_DN5_c0_g2~~TRINITY_DN5_c0_g2_i1.p1  ORF type:complete len:381 (+),score=174.43 TRINITY_DN5_c0_g2_i1:49-1191(+)
MSLGDKFREFTSKTYKEQGVAFLNAYWSEVQKDAEEVWRWVHMFVELDVQKKAEGSDLDEFNAHRFLEKVQETKTVKELREQLKAIDLDFNKRMAMLEYCLFRYKKSVSDFVGRPQGDNSKEIEQASAMLEAVQKALDESLRAAAEAKQAADDSKAAAAAAKVAADEAAKSAAAAAARAAEAAERAAEAAARAAEAKAAEDEQRAALADVQSQEDARNKKTEELKAKGEDQNLGVVARNKAKNELAQHLAEDPLPLRKAKITLEAATKKAAKATAVAEEAKAKADDAKAQADAAKAQADADKAEADARQQAAEEAAAEAERAAEAAEEAVRETERKVAEAEAYLEEQKQKSGSGQGSVWFLQRELEEKKKYMPKSKGGKW